LEELNNGQKERQRTGKAIYNIAGEFTKQGGSYKSWKTRWFVVDDSSVSYYKEKSEWENGPLLGVPKTPQGVIPFAEILDITKHDEPSKCTGITNRPKGAAGQFCLHVLTKARTFNIIGFQTEQDSQQWLTVLKKSVAPLHRKESFKEFFETFIG